MIQPLINKQKSMYFILIISLVLTLDYNRIYAQNQTNKPATKFIVENRRPIQIGDFVPDVDLKKIIAVDGSLSSAKLSDYQDKLLLLDLMYTGCSSCIAGLVEKNNLQQQFGNKIKIMVVVGGEEYFPGALKTENEEYIRKYLNSQNYLSFHGVRIPWVVENYDLNRLFRHLYVSHLVWIYKGKLIAITEQDYVTAENIQLVLDGKQNHWPVKNDFLPSFDSKRTLMEQYPEPLNRLIAKNERIAVFGAYQDGVFPKRVKVLDSISHKRREYFINRPILNLYYVLWQEATGQSRYSLPSHVLLEVEKPTDYIKQEDTKEYSYETRQRTYRSVEFNSPDTGQSTQQQASYMIRELDNVLGLEGRYEKRTLKCLVLCRTDSNNRFKATIQKSDGGFSRSTLTPPQIDLNSARMATLVFKLNQYYGNPPVFDETNYKRLIDMKFQLNSWMDISALKKVLQRYGLDLREEERELEVFVLTERKKM